MTGLEIFGYTCAAIGIAILIAAGIAGYNAYIREHGEH
jgi:hypothetical protein